jgi:hypothetical protein
MATNWDRLHSRLWLTSSRMLGQVPVVYGAISTYGMFDRKSELLFDDQIVSIENALTIKTSELGSLRYGDQLLVDGEAYQVRSEPMRMADGMLSVVSLEQIQIATVYLITLSGLRIKTLDGRSLVATSGAASETTTVILNGDFL